MSEYPTAEARTGQRGAVKAQGRMAEVLSWTDNCVLKLYRPGSLRSQVDQEVLGARVAKSAGLPTPAVREVIMHGGRVGILFERADGPTLLQALGERPTEAAALARRLAELHAAVHGCAAGALPAQRRQLRAAIGRARALSGGMKAAVLGVLDMLPDGDALCHGDFHPGNVIISSAGLVLFDWFDASRGEPVADVARTVLLLSHAPLPNGLAPEAGQAIRAVRAAFCAAYLRHYAGLRAAPPERLAAWLLPTAAARLADDLPPAEHEAVLALVSGSLPNL